MKTAKQNPAAKNSHSLTHQKKPLASKKERDAAAILETAQDLFEAGDIDTISYNRVMQRHLGRTAGLKVSGAQIRAMRTRARMSVETFAMALNMSPAQIYQFESGTRTPKGAALAMLNVVRCKGVGAILV